VTDGISPAPRTKREVPDKSEINFAAAESDLSLYARADKSTRAAIDREFDSLRWERRQGVYLRWAGLLSGLIIALSFLAAGAWLIDAGYGIEGGVIASVDIVALVTVFVVQVRSRDE
jgi:hypothetical protein